MKNKKPSGLLSLTEDKLDKTLRPRSWKEFVGQERIKKTLQVMLEAARKRAESHVEHILFYGPSGLGKTTLSHLLAQELPGELKITTGPSLERVGDLAAILTSLQEGDVLFIDECHRLSKQIEEVLYSALDEFKLHLVMGKGLMAKTVEIKLKPFTLIGATTRLGSLSGPLRNRFGALFQLQFYSAQELKEILKRSAYILGVEIEEKALEEIARRSRFTPRIANRLLKRVRDWAQVEGKGNISHKIALEAFEWLEIDELGLTPADRKILKVIVERFKGGPVGLKTLAAACHEQEEAIVEIYEPYLMHLGFLERTPRGRVVTSKGFYHLKKSTTKNLFA